MISEQIKNLEMRYQTLQKVRDLQSTPQIDMNHQSIEIDQAQQDFQFASSVLPIKKKYPSHSLNKTGPTYKYLSDKKNLPHQNITYASPFQKKVYPNQNEPQIDLMNIDGSRNFETPREKYRKKKHSFRNSDLPLKNNDSSRFTQNTQITQNEFSPARANVLNVNLLNPEDQRADSELENATREELLHAIKLLKKQNQTLERKHKNELEALKFRTQRVEMEQSENGQSSRQKDAKIRELENKLKDKEKELEIVYMKIKNSSENTPLAAFNSTKKPLILDSLNLKDSNSQISQQTKSINGTKNIIFPTKFDMDQKQDIRNQVGNGFQHLDDELLKSTTHGKLKRITVWSNYERIHGISFQYLKHDGTVLEPNVNIFASKNLRVDYMDFDVEDDNDYVEEIQGKYNIKGVKDLIITSPQGKTKHFKPINTDKSREQENNDLDEVFTVKYDYIEKPLKIVFPNMFSYDMKGARLYDKHDQNFYYIESTRCVSLSNPSLVYIAGVPAVRMPAKSDPNDELLQNAPMTNHYYSDNADASNLKEIKEDGVGKVNWTDSELIFFEKKVKIYKMTVYSDSDHIYGFWFQYLTTDGLQVIVGKKHVGIQHLDKLQKELLFDTPEITLTKMFFYRNKLEQVYKLIIHTSDGKRIEYGKSGIDKDSKEVLLELKPSSYIYGSFIFHPLQRTPGDFIVSNLRVGEIKPN